MRIVVFHQKNTFWFSLQQESLVQGWCILLLQMNEYIRALSPALGLHSLGPTEISKGLSRPGARCFTWVGAALVINTGWGMNRNRWSSPPTKKDLGVLVGERLGMIQVSPCYSKDLDLLESKGGPPRCLERCSPSPMRKG